MLWCHQSSNSGRIRRPGGGVKLDFSKSFEFGGARKHVNNWHIITLCEGLNCHCTEKGYYVSDTTYPV